jgi:hypothetical protein
MTILYDSSRVAAAVRYYFEATMTRFGSFALLVAALALAAPAGAVDT